MQQHYESVKQFMEKAGQEMPTKPTVPSEEVRLCRARLTSEESFETINALGVRVYMWVDGQFYEVTHDKLVFKATGEPDLVEIADGSCDITVIATGTLHACGIDPAPIQAAVDESNLAKFRGDWQINEHGKLIKPSNWVAPDIAGLIEQQRKVAEGKVRWDEYQDIKGNTCYEADSPYHDDGVHFQWRLRKRLRDDKIVWQADHDSELGGYGDEWDSIYEAKLAIEEQHEQILADAANEQEDDQ